MSDGDLAIISAMCVAVIVSHLLHRRRERMKRAEDSARAALVRAQMQALEAKVDANTEETAAARRASDAATAGVRLMEQAADRAADAVRKSKHDG